ncbi:MAG: hypothetical protein H6R04_991 [Burkholderiaceae bacterium]|nr:hypothetical protein [Burkholderiaceae bacterium]
MNPSKHLRPVATFALFLLLCASFAYWGMRMFTPAPRPHAAPAAPPPANVEAAGSLFGGRATAAKTGGHFLLKGVVGGGSANGVAIISINGQPARAVPIGAEVAPGVTVSEVGVRHVQLSEGGVRRQIDLQEIPRKAGVTPSSSSAPPATPAPPAAPPPPRPGTN